MSSSVAPGGSSTETTERAASSAGMKPVGSSDVLQIDTANSPMPASSVSQRQRSVTRRNPV